MVLQREQQVVVVTRNRIPEDLLVREEPQTREDVKGGREGQNFQGFLDQGGVIHGRLLVGISHSTLLTDVVDAQTDKGDGEEQGHAWPVQERDVDHVDDGSEAVVHEEQGALVNGLKLLDRSRVSLRAIAREARFLIGAATHKPEQVEAESLDQGRKYADNRG